MNPPGDCKACSNTRKNSNGGPCWPCLNKGWTTMAVTTQPNPTMTARVDRVESGCSWIADDSIDLAVLSPPYFKRDGATDVLFHALGELLGRVLKPGARAFVVLGQVSEEFDRIYNARAEILVGSGGALHTEQTIVWVKSFAYPPDPTMGHYTPLNSEHLLYYGHEMIFRFVKDRAFAPPLAKLAIGVPYADKSNLDRGTRGKNGDLHDPGDVWFIPYDTTGSTTKKAHRHAYPPELVRRAIKVANPRPGATIFDPFIGGGTTADVARELGYGVVAVDCDPECIKALTTSWGIPPAPDVVTRPFTPASVAPPSPNVVPDGDGGHSRRRRRSKSLAAMLASIGELPDVDPEGEEPDDPGENAASPPPIPGKMCGTPGCSNPQMHRTNSGDLCLNGHGEFTGKPALRKKVKKVAKKKAAKR